MSAAPRLHRRPERPGVAECRADSIIGLSRRRRVGLASQHRAPSATATGALKYTSWVFGHRLRQAGPAGLDGTCGLERKPGRTPPAAHEAPRAGGQSTGRPNALTSPPAATTPTNNSLAQAERRLVSAMGLGASVQVVLWPELHAEGNSVPGAPPRDLPCIERRVTASIASRGPRGRRWTALGVDRASVVGRQSAGASPAQVIRCGCRPCVRSRVANRGSARALLEP